MLYEADQRTLAPEALLEERIADPGREAALPAYAVRIVRGVVEQRERIDEFVATYSHGWTLERMPAIDRSLLRIGTWEILFNAEVPDTVAIAEAVDLAQLLSTDDSPAFVNGLLSRLAELKETLLA